MSWGENLARLVWCVYVMVNYVKRGGGTDKIVWRDGVHR